MSEEKKDAFSLSDDEFDDILANLPQDEEVAEETKEKSESTEEEQFDFSFITEEPKKSEETKEKSEESIVTGFDPGKGDEQIISLVHNGEVKQLPMNEVIDLAQKGFDYREKTTNIASKRRLIDLVEGDPELQEMINQRVLGKTLPEISKRDDFETEEEWLKDNMTRAQAASNPVVDIKKEESTTETTVKKPEDPPIVKMMRMRDPQNFDKVAPYLPGAVQNLMQNREEYLKVASSPDNVFDFYDKVKSQVIPKSNPKTASGKKTFNLRSGQGTSAPATTPNKKNVWDLSNREFDALVTKAQGY